MTAHEDLSRIHAVKTSSNRAFGWVFTCAFLVVGLWPLVAHGRVRMWSLVVSGAFLVATLAAPALLALPNRLWQRVGYLLNRLVSPLVLAFLFYVVVTPMGMLMRALSKSNLKWRRGGEGSSYWIKRDPPGPKPESLNHQF
jgi:nitrate reductase NapE component